MPLRDHFHPPVRRQRSWEALLCQWTPVIVQGLHKTLPQGYVAAPLIESVAHRNETPSQEIEYPEWLGPPTHSVELDWSESRSFAVNVYKVEEFRSLCAAILIVSPDDSLNLLARTFFAAKCVNLLNQGIAVTIVDINSTSPLNLYHDFLTLLGHSNSKMCADPPALYATSTRIFPRKPRSTLKSWAEELSIDQRIPAMPLWLADDAVIALDLEQSYERACYDLRIT